MKYILASASPRRKELLKRTGLEFDIIPSTCKEKTTKDKPCDIVMELARIKALDVFGHLDPACDCTVIGADTIVVYNEEILGKPSGASEACDMLSMLSDRTHQVYTGVSLISRTHGREQTRTFYEKTDVTFYPVSKEDLHTYVDSGDALDKAGAYGIQGNFAIHVKQINGDYNNVVGLPIGRLYQELLRLK